MEVLKGFPPEYRLIKIETSERFPWLSGHHGLEQRETESREVLSDWSVLEGELSVPRRSLTKYH